MNSGEYIMCSDYPIWKSIIQEELSHAESFEIHCWNEETQAIELALQHGCIKPFDWSHGKVIAGAVTPEFISWLMALPMPEKTDIGMRMTPFFSIFLDTGFSSEHYGTELIKR